MNVMGNFSGETTNTINLTRSVITCSKYLSVSQIGILFLSLII